MNNINVSTDFVQQDFDLSDDLAYDNWHLIWTLQSDSVLAPFLVAQGLAWRRGRGMEQSQLRTPLGMTMS